MPTVRAGMHPVSPRTAGRRSACRRASALLIAIFVMTITTVLVVAMLDSQMLEMTAQRNTLDYERALYLAGAGVHHALALMESSDNPFQDFTIEPIEFPSGSGNTYQAEATQVDEDVVITGSGTSGGVTRYLQATITAE